MKILVAGFQHETNTFAPTVASYESFVNGEDFPALARGGQILELLNVNIPISGFVNHVRTHGHDVIPVIWAGAGASAHVTRDAYERITGEILKTVANETYDAIYLDLHGAMVAQHIDDGEGELLARVRAITGAAVKISVSVDSHANVTTQMLELADCIVAYRTYPHVDMADTGKRAAELLLQLSAHPTKAFKTVRRLPFLIPVNSMSTMMQPARGIYDLLEELETTDVLSLSFAPGFPASDFPECGPVVWGYGFSSEAIDRAVCQLYERIAEPEQQWAVAFEEAAGAVQKAIKIAETANAPVIIADTQDNPGVGGDSNTTGLLRELIGAGAEGVAVGLIWDAVSAAAAHRAGVGAKITLSLGGC
ncbi:MAG: M81 family peptidase, partial [Alcaligenaceae bacterium]